MPKDRLYVSPDYKAVIEELREKDVLGIKLAENKEIFMFAVALGLMNPTPLKKRDGLSLYTALKTEDRSLMASVLMGTVTNNDEIDKYADFDASTDLCEKCAEAGYAVLQKEYNDADCDEELFERRMINKLKDLYRKNVKYDVDIDK